MGWREIIAASLRRHGMLRSGRRIGVAVSGGADSVFLLHALREMELAACILHVNHQLRGAESDGDEAFVRDLGGRFELPVHVAVLPVRDGNMEQEARRARYDFFGERIAAGCCDAVATGHTLDDQAETVLSRFLRGAGSAGLSGILPVTESGMIRPLLELRRDDIRGFLTGNGIRWREDDSNADTEFLRNRIRHEIMPQLALVNPSIAPVMASTAEWARAEEEYWFSELDRLEPEYLQFEREAILIRTGPFLALPIATQRRLLRRGIERIRGSLRGIDFRHVEGIRGLTETREGSGRIQLPDLDVYRSFDWLRLAPLGFDSRLERDFETGLLVPGTTAIPARHLTVEMELISHPHVYNKDVDALDWEKCAGSLTVRNWRPGDAYVPKGKTSVEKIKALFQEYRVPLWERRTWPVVVLEADKIVWTRQFGVAEEFAARPESGRVLLIGEGDSRQSRESKETLSASIESVRARTKKRIPRLSEENGEQDPDKRGAEVL